MKNQGVLLCLTGLLLSAIVQTIQSPAQAAKKYYPPGFVPPSDQKLLPTASPPAEPAPTVIIQPTPGNKQVIIKTIAVEKVRPVKPRDPLLTLMDEHRYYDALRLVNSRLGKSPNDLTLQMTRGQILRAEGNFQEAILQYNEILEKSRNKPKGMRAGALNGLGWTHYNRALYAQKHGDRAGFESGLSAADSAFRQATRLSPGFSHAWAGLAKVALANRRVSDAEQWVKKAKTYGHNNLSVQLAEAELLLAQKKPEEALQHLYGIKKTTTREPEVFLLLAKASLETGRVDDAIINLKQMLQIVPEDADGLKLLSQSYELKMKPEDAAQALEKAIALNPSDMDSVDALLKIYDQRKQSDRGILLLKTLLKDRPGQPYLAQLLLSRLAEAECWDEAYTEGLGFVGIILSDPNANGDAQQAVVNLFLQAAYQHGRGLINRQDLLRDPVTAQARQFAQSRLNAMIANGESAQGYDITNRLNLLFLDPLQALPPLPESYTPSDAQLGETLQLHFLQGNRAQYQRLLNYAKTASAHGLALARQLFQLGDYSGAQALLSAKSFEGTAQAEEARTLQQRVHHSQKLLEEHVASLSILPRRISNAYWQNAVKETLKVGCVDGRAHAQVARSLERRDQEALALLHQRLAAQYATDPKDEKYWRRQADKKARHLGLSLTAEPGALPSSARP
jgi:tetratricopeptide (TPR) repeat protein